MVIGIDEAGRGPLAGPVAVGLVRAAEDFDFASAFTKDNWMATQFHPEKSGKLGLQLYANFLKFASHL